MGILIVCLIFIYNRTSLYYRGVVMVGPGAVIDSSYFRELGTYDEGMAIWGGENLELPWRVCLLITRDCDCILFMILRNGLNLNAIYYSASSLQLLFPVLTLYLHG